jgi:hypothetical protein
MNTTNLIAADAELTGASASFNVKKPVTILTPKARATKAQMMERRAALVAASRQTRLGSLIEACINVLIGFGINFTANLIILPLIGFQISVGQNLFIGVLYTVISVVRSYTIRRWFNTRIHAAALKLAKAQA